jgi:hypothetical protein
LILQCPSIQGLALAFWLASLPSLVSFVRFGLIFVPQPQPEPHECDSLTIGSCRLFSLIDAAFLTRGFIVARFGARIKRLAGREHIGHAVASFRCSIDLKQLKSPQSSQLKSYSGMTVQIRC